MKIETPTVKNFPMASVNEWNSPEIIILNYQQAGSGNYDSEEARLIALTSEFCQQRMAISCLSQFAMLTDLSFDITSVFNSKSTDFPGSSIPSKCPCFAEKMCPVNCKCNGTAVNTFDEGTPKISAYEMAHNQSLIIPFKKIEFKISKNIDLTFKVNIGTFKCSEYIRLGILFSFDKFEDKIFPINNQFNKSYDEKMIAVEDNHRKAVRFYSTNGANMWGAIHSNLRCFGEISDCALGLSMSLWFRPSTSTSYAVLVMTNNTNSGYKLVFDNDRIKAEVYVEKEIWRASSFPFSINQWINVIFSWHNFKGISLYINNIEAIENGGTSSHQKDGVPEIRHEKACSEPLCLNIGFYQNGKFLGFDDFYISESYLYNEIDRRILFLKGLGGFHENLDNITLLTDDIGWIWNINNIEQTTGVINEGIKLGSLSLTMINGCPTSFLNCRNGFSIAFWYKLPVNFGGSSFFSLDKVLNISYIDSGMLSIESMYFSEKIEISTSVGVWAHISLSIANSTLNLTYNTLEYSNFNATPANQHLINDAITWKFTGENVLIDEIFFDIEPITNDYLKNLTSKTNKKYEFDFEFSGYEELFSGEYYKKFGVYGKSILSDKTIYSNYSLSKECFANFEWCQNGYILSFWLRVVAHSHYPLIQIFNLKTSLTVYYDPHSETLTGTFYFTNTKTTFKSNLKKNFWNLVLIKISLNKHLEIFVNGESKINERKTTYYSGDNYLSSKFELGDDGPSTLQFDELHFQDGTVLYASIVGGYGKFK